MLKTLWGVVKKEKIQLLEKEKIPEGTKVLITVLPEDNESLFWTRASEVSLHRVWDNTEDNIYEELLKK